MKKRESKMAAAVLLAGAMLVEAMVFGACGSADTAGNAGTEAAETQPTETERAASHTVTFYDSDGTTVLSTEEVADGACAEEYEPQKEGSVFVGWFATPQMSHAYDFAQAVTEDTSVFAGFVSYAEDTREWAILGSGTSPALLESNWGAVIGDAQKLTKEEADSANIYTITLDLSEGDEFQFAIDSSWNNQRGFGYLETGSADGTKYFESAGGLGNASADRSNIKCLVSGSYTFTLTTYPAEDVYDTEDASYTEDNKEAFNSNPYDKITWTYNGAGSGASGDIVTEYYIKGAVITGWEDVYSDETKFTEEDGVYTLKIELGEGDEFLFTTLVIAGDTSSVGTEYVRYTNIAADDTESLSHVTEGSGENMVAAESGTYVFTYVAADKLLTVAVE